MPGKPKTDPILLIGQGLAGSLLAHFLEEAGMPFHLIDSASPRAASRVAAGLINPITGRHYVKAWRVDELIPFAVQTYTELARKLGVPLFHPYRILRSLFNQKDENNWTSRSGDPAYAPYMVDEPDPAEYKGHIVAPFALGEVQHGGRADVGELVRAYQSHLIEEGLLQLEHFAYDRLEGRDGMWSYDGHLYRQVVFCEGYWGKFNPWFGHLPFRGVKGEVFRIAIPGTSFSKIIKKRVFVIPLGGHEYWAGATHENTFPHIEPTPEGANWLHKQLSELLTVPYEVIDHISAVRPTVADRRPYLGKHAEFPGLYLFNGLGTRGASLGPFFAKQMADHLTRGLPLDPEVDIARFAIK